ncbi:MAG: DUF429 domain-containing protein [Pseudomonadota bacterium]
MFYGVDGCPGGWIGVGLDAAGASRARLAASFAQLMAALESPARVLVDMPIGLPSERVPQRLCDTAARRLLGRRGSSVFPVPSRAALAAHDYLEACDINAAELGRRLSKQTWNITGKIRELDDYLATATLPCPVQEMHPEVAFAVLNGGVALADSKKTPAGREARLALLREHAPDAEEIASKVRHDHTRRQVADDDILDALVGAVTARFDAALETLPETPIHDDRGLRMAIMQPPRALMVEARHRQ